MNLILASCGCGVCEGVITGQYTARVSPTSEHHQWLSRLAGRFIVFEGPDGSGKTTQFERLVSLARRAGLGVCDVREPGGTAIGERVRQILLDPRCSEMSLRCEMLLYMASRAQLVDERLRPALAGGEVVIADRFVSSTLAYQGAGGGLPDEEILASARVACREVWPDLVLIFDVDEATAASRRKAEADRIESRDEAYRKNVREGYLAQARREPDRHAVIPASGDADDVTETMLATLAERFSQP